MLNRISSRCLGGCLIIVALYSGYRTQPLNLYQPPVSYNLVPAILTATPAAARLGVLRMPHRPTRRTPVRPKQITDEAVCLAQNIFFESAYEPLEGIEAVAAVVFNRKTSKFYPNTICGVVYQAKQFSWTADYSKWRRIPPLKYIVLAKTLIANRTLIQSSYDHLTHFHHVGISPRWGQSSMMDYRATYGQHKFYAWMLAAS